MKKKSKKLRGFKCAQCGYEGFDFKIGKSQYTFCVGKWLGDASHHLAHRFLEQEYQRKNGKLVLLCPQCSSSLIE